VHDDFTQRSRLEVFLKNAVYTLLFKPSHNDEKLL